MREMWEKKTTAHAVRPFDVLRANDWSTRSPHDRNVREQGRRRRRFRLILPSVNSSSRALWRNMLVPESARFRKKVAFSHRFERQRTRANGLLAETEGLEPLL